MNEVPRNYELEASTRGEKNYELFVASRFGEFASVRAELASIDRRIWIAEARAPNLSKFGEEAITNACLDQVAKCKVFVLLTGVGYGSMPAALVRNPLNSTTVGVNVSLLEMEVLQALIQRKEFLWIHLSGREPEPKLESLLLVVRGLAHVTFIETSSNAIVPVILGRMSVTRRWARSIAATLPAPLRHSLLREPRHLYKRTLAGGFPLFFARRVSTSSSTPDAAFVEALIVQAEGSPNFARRLAILWVVFRALASARIDDPTKSDFLPAWDRALSLWSGTAAWFGMHVPNELSPLAALACLRDVRVLRFGASAIELRDVDGGVASSLYSLSKLTWGANRRRLIESALSYVNAALARSQCNISGLLAVRASILGERGNLALACAEMERVSKLKALENFGPGPQGEALVEHGFLLYRTGHREAAIKQMENGVALLAAVDSPNFECRARQKLGLCYLLSLRIRDAYYQLAVAQDLVERCELNGRRSMLAHRFLAPLIRAVRKRTFRPKGDRRNV